MVSKHDFSLKHFIFFESDDEDSSSSSSDDEEVITAVINSIARMERNAVKQYSEMTVPYYSEEEFKRHFRVSKDLMSSLTLRYSTSHVFLQYLHEKGRDVIEPVKHMQVFLWYAGHSTSYIDIADRFNITPSTLFEIITRINTFFDDIASEIIKWPSREEMEKTKADVFQRTGFPDVIGFIDGTHIKIDKPTTNQESYCNRKQYHSIQVQIICDHNCKIIDVFIGYPGSVHDARVFKSCFIYHQLEEICEDGHLLGDSAYPCLNVCLTPYKDNGHMNRQQIHYNKIHSSARIKVEHTNGLLKQRFRQLYHVKLRKIERIVAFVKSCCVLHNLCHVGDKTLFDNEQDLMDSSEINIEMNDDTLAEGSNVELGNGFMKRDNIARHL